MRILNVGEVINCKDTLLASFHCIGDNFKIDRLECANMQDTQGFETLFENFKFSVNISGNLTSCQKDVLLDKLYKYKSIVVTDDNPDLGYTKIVEHRITLKSDNQYKHHKPYRLAPDKRERFYDVN